jgi:hypothetical protein
MNAEQKMEEKLWLYIDGDLPADEVPHIERLLEAEATWKAKYRELLEVSALLRASELDAPSMRFTRNVMEEISRMHIAPATRTYINRKIVWGIGMFFITMLAGILVYAFAQLDSGGQASELGKTLDKFDFTRLFSNTWVNVLLGANVILGLVFLDFYLSNRRQEMRKSRQ